MGQEKPWGSCFSVLLIARGTIQRKKKDHWKAPGDCPEQLCVAPQGKARFLERTGILESILLPTTSLPTNFSRRQGQLCDLLKVDLR